MKIRPSTQTRWSSGFSVRTISRPLSICSCSGLMCELDCVATSHRWGARASRSGVRNSFSSCWQRLFERRRMRGCPGRVLHCASSARTSSLVTDAFGSVRLSWWFNWLFSEKGTSMTLATSVEDLWDKARLLRQIGFPYTLIHSHLTLACSLLLGHVILCMQEPVR